MISRINGILLEKKPPLLLIDVNGVGYEIAAPIPCFYHLPNIEERVTLHTHLIIREDGQTLYGFLQLQDRQLFRELIKVNGIGPKLALTILSGMETPQFILCVQLKDTASLCRIPGIGKKTAERLLIEMGDALAKWSSDSTLPNTQAVFTENSALQDALSALVALGYKESDVQRAFGKMETENKTTENLIREVLKKI